MEYFFGTLFSIGGSVCTEASTLEGTSDETETSASDEASGDNEVFDSDEPSERYAGVHPRMVG